MATRKKNKFQLESDFQPAGDQPQAIKALTKGLKEGKRYQTLLGVTGSGKTFTAAHLIQNIQKPTLVIAPNKTLAAQLYQEYKSFFPKNRVCYFVSYYDYYQPEAYLPTTDTYIEKEAMINEEIDRFRHLATSSLLTRTDVIVVASVSCIYNLGLPENYFDSVIKLEVGNKITRQDLIKNLIKIGFERNETELKRGNFRVRGDVLEVQAASDEIIYRINLEEQEIKTIAITDSITRKIKEDLTEILIFPPKHFVTTLPERERAIQDIKDELKERLKFYKKEGKLLEAERLERRTKYDMEMIQTLGFCHGIETYSRHLTGKLPGQSPDTLLEYFPKDNDGKP
ncbi:MAG: DEAD/DEAH box helicase family protein, partial [bacterium]|nr:DEAD/DEAH box helicase family protein [bacterium]